MTPNKQPEWEQVAVEWLEKESVRVSVLTDLHTLIKEIVSSHTTHWKERVRSLMDYLEHDNQCIISQAHRGRPTNDGGYETQYGNKWYRSPNKPKCDCGLDTLLENLNKGE